MATFAEPFLDMVEATLESKLSNETLHVANPGVPLNFVGKGHLMNRDVVWKNLCISGCIFKRQVGRGIEH